MDRLNDFKLGENYPSAERDVMFKVIISHRPEI